VHLSIVNNRNLKPKAERVNPRTKVFFIRKESQFYHRSFEEDPKYSGSILKQTYFSSLLESIPDSNLELNPDLSNLSPASVLPYTAELTRNLLNEKLGFSSPELMQLALFIKSKYHTALFFIYVAVYCLCYSMSVVLFHEKEM